MTAGPIRTIAIAGDGVAGWAAAATLARRLRGVAVHVVPVDAPPQVTDVLATMEPAARAFHDRLRLSQGEVIAATRGTLRLGVRLDGWWPHRSALLAGHGGHLPADTPPGLAAALAVRDPAAFADLSPAAALAAAGRVADAAADPASPLALVDPGLAADPARYRAYLRACALHHGAREAGGRLQRVAATGDRIASLQLADGRSVEADLFIDASGPAALLIGTMPGGAERRSWREWLPIDRLHVADAPATATPPPFDSVAAAANGWLLSCPLGERTITARAYAATGLRDGEAAREIGAKMPAIHLDQGRRARAWIGNCVAIGDAAVEVEPLRAAPSLLLHAACERIVALLPDTGFATVEIDHYNREWAAEADRLRDFLILHYVVAGRREPFWRQAGGVSPPVELDEALALFGERGRLPHRDHQSFAPDQWLGLLLGAGVRPRRVDALASAIAPSVLAAYLADRRRRIARAVAQAPTHSDHLRRLRGARAA